MYAIPDQDLARLAGMPLGTIVVQSGLVQREDVEDAILESVATGRRLGQVLVSRGLLTQEYLLRLLDLQGRTPEEINAPAPHKQLVRTLEKDGKSVVTLRCHPISGGAAVECIVHAADGTTRTSSTAFSSRDEGYAYVEETTLTFRMLGCTSTDWISDAPQGTAPVA
jgi:hypothetical protein